VVLKRDVGPTGVLLLHSAAVSCILKEGSLETLNQATLITLAGLATEMARELFQLLTQRS